MISIQINGENKMIGEQNLAAILEQYADAKSPFAIAINEQFIPRDQYSSTQLKPGDRVEIVSPMQGG